MTDRLSDAQVLRMASCPEHGGYESRNILRSVWTRCPACEELRRAGEAEEEARRQQRIAERRHADRLRGARIPARFIGRTFDNFRADSDGQKRALTVARDFAEQFADNRRRGQGLILLGMPGTGKSHLASAIMQTMLERSICYVTCLDMIREVRDTWRKGSDRGELDVLDAFGTMDLLVIDEVGVQYGTEGEQTIIFDVLDRRYREVLPTILLTNQDSAGLKQFIGDRTFDRLTETCRWVAFDWPSYRIQARKDDTARSLPRAAGPVSDLMAGPA
jgi:DNA replication protein DnaC